MMLGREQITGTPQTASYTSGVCVLTPGTPYIFWGSVQPASQSTLERLPEGARKSTRWIVYAKPPTPVVNFSAPGDRLTTSKGTLIPIAKMDFSSHTTGLPHAAYACAEVGDDE